MFSFSPSSQHTHTLLVTPSFSSSCSSSSSSSSGIPQFFLVGIHTQPSNVLAELNALVEVYEEAVDHFGTENGIMLGDFNADCSYLSQRRYNTLLLANDSRFTWLLDTDIDSTTGNSNCAYDRCVCVYGVGVGGVDCAGYMCMCIYVYMCTCVAGEVSS